MTITIRPANSRARFRGIDLHHRLPAAVAAIEAGMDRFAVLAFRDQRIDDAQQLAFTRNFGPLELATGDILQTKRGGCPGGHASPTSTATTG